MRARDTAFTPKCTYDEDYRRFSPGFLLEYFVIEAFYAGDGASEMDACTTSDGHVIAGFWNGAKPDRHAGGWPGHLADARPRLLGGSDARRARAS